jgi:homoserine dehydrogenase
MPVRAIVVGLGNIGKVLKTKINALPDWKVIATVSKRSVFDGTTGNLIREFTPDAFHVYLRDVAGDGKPVVVFLAIPSQNGGEAAGAYIEQAVACNVPIVTCEKGALSHQFALFADKLDKIGYSATVGGGTRILPSLMERMNGRRDVVLHGVVNGTLNFIFNEMDHAGSSFGTAVEKAQALGYAEPGASEGVDILNGEMSDTVMKTSILFNICMNTGTYMNPDSIAVLKINQSILSHLIREASVRRYIVSLFPPEFDGELPPEKDIIGGFRYDISGWRIRAGFQRTDSDPLFRGRLPMGANNAVITCEGKGGEDGIYVLGNGPGAGPKPTTASMLGDARKLLRL